MSEGGRSDDPRRRSPTLIDLAQATPATRDRYVDFLRATSILVVVLGHWLIAIIEWDGGEISGRNALDELPGLWLATWILQVMPIFFFVGGFSNSVTLDSVGRGGGSYPEFIKGRVDRLMRPTLVFLGVWIPIAIAADLLTGFDDRTMDLATTLLTRPLWFIGIYLIMIAFAPPMLALHRRFGVGVLIAMVAGAAAVDSLAIGAGVPFIGYLNFAFVWLFVHQLGFFYADGSFTARTKRFFGMLCLVGLGALVAATALEVYSPSMVGLRNERSNTNPPTLAIVALTVWQVGLIMLLREPLSRWLQRVRVWARVIFLNLVIMTLFLWHQTAMILAAAILLPLGFPQPQAGSIEWWALRPLWVVALGLVLATLVAVFGRLERLKDGKLGPQDPSPSRTLIAAVGTTLVLWGILGFAVTGFDAFASPAGEALVMFEMNPLANAVNTLLGLWLLAASIRTMSRVRYTIPPVILVLAGCAALISLMGNGVSGVLSGNLANAVTYGVAAVLLLVSIAGVREGPITTTS